MLELQQWGQGGWEEATVESLIKRWGKKAGEGQNPDLNLIGKSDEQEEYNQIELKWDYWGEGGGYKRVSRDLPMG